MNAIEAINELQSYADNSWGGLNEAFEAAVSALKKQVPKKPTYVDTRFRNHGKNISDGVSLSKCYKCPNCTLHIFHVFDSETHCKFCGQALDWNDC